MSRICITSYYTSGYKDIGKLSWKSIEAYALKYGYDKRLFTEPLSTRPAAWNKILIIKKLLNEGYEFVFWVDADALIVSSSRDILDLVEKDKDLYMVKHKNGKHEIPNTGVMLVRNSLWAQKFLDRVWQHEEFIRHDWWENAALMDILGYSRELLFKDLEEINKRRVDKVSEERIKWLDYEWNCVPGLYDAEIPIIKHWAGIPYEQKIKVIGEEAYRFQIASAFELIWLAFVRRNYLIFLSRLKFYFRHPGEIARLIRKNVSNK